MGKLGNYTKAVSTGFFGIIYLIIIMFGGFIFPLLYIFCDISWVKIICIIYAAIYALASVLGRNIIPYIIVYIINIIILIIQGHENYWLISFIEVPLLVSVYIFISGFFKKKGELNDIR